MMRAKILGRPRLDRKGRIIHDSVNRRKLIAMCAVESKREIAAAVGCDPDLLGKLAIGLYRAPQTWNAVVLQRKLGLMIEDWFRR